MYGGALSRVHRPRRPARRTSSRRPAVDDLTVPVAAQPARVAAARSALSTVHVWGRALPLPLRLAAAAAAAELQARAGLPCPPAPVPAADPRLTPAAAAALLATCLLYTSPSPRAGLLSRMP